MTAVDVSATVALDPLFQGFPASGTVQIGSEFIYYASHTSTTLDGLVRGVCGTTAAAHSAADPVLAIYSSGVGAAAQCSQPWDFVVTTVQQAPVLNMSKTDLGSVVAGQAYSFLLTAGNMSARRRRRPT